MAAFAARHRLAPAHRAGTPVEVARSLVALRSTDPASVPLAVAARTTGAGAPVAAVDAALYDDRSIVRVMGMRRTIWVVPAELAPVAAAACGRAIAANERRTLVKLLESEGVAGDGERWLAEVEAEVLAAVAERGSALTTEITEDVPLLKGTITLGGATKWATRVGLGTRVVLVLSCEGRIVRERPRGAWTSSQYRSSVAPPGADALSEADGQAELARRWVAAFGADSVDEPEPWAALLPALDPTTMGWKQRDWYLGELGPQLFDRNGNAGPTVWWSGRIVGGWAQRPSGEVAIRLLVDIGSDGAAAVEAAGGVVRPRFPTPLQRALSA